MSAAPASRTVGLPGRVLEMAAVTCSAVGKETATQRALVKRPLTARRLQLANIKPTDALPASEIRFQRLYPVFHWIPTFHHDSKPELVVRGQSRQRQVPAFLLRMHHEHQSAMSFLGSNLNLVLRLTLGSLIIIVVAVVFLRKLLRACLVGHLIHSTNHDPAAPLFLLPDGDGGRIGFLGLLLCLEFSVCLDPPLQRVQIDSRAAPAQQGQPRVRTLQVFEGVSADGELAHVTRGKHWKIEGGGAEVCLQRARPLHPEPQEIGRCSPEFLGVADIPVRHVERHRRHQAVLDEPDVPILAVDEDTHCALPRQSALP
mmetsp:Transcript_63635/g.170464  ORF Transcript_63635/g.170464 Transcript_63635/m.170464 type:complete len:315 (-) Transcript_63635:586-1530(-)